MNAIKWAVLAALAFASCQVVTRAKRKGNMKDDKSEEILAVFVEDKKSDKRHIRHERKSG